jgi:DNA-binding NarL/FixJ family response regulator
VIRRRVVLVVVEDEWVRGMVMAALRDDVRLNAHSVRSHEVLLRAVTESIVPDLALVEVPAGGGAEFLRGLRAAAKRLPIVALLPGFTHDRANQLIAAGCDDVLPLPAPPEELLAVVRRLALPG